MEEEVQGMRLPGQALKVTKEEAAGFLPERPWDGHKGTFGKVCVAGGSVGLTSSGSGGFGCGPDRKRPCLRGSSPGNISHNGGDVS